MPAIEWRLVSAFPKSAAADTNAWMQAKYDYENPPALKCLIAGGAVLRQFTPEIMDACLKATEETYAEIAAKNPTFKKVLDSMMSFRDDAYLYWQVSELAHDSTMARSRRSRG